MPRWRRKELNEKPCPHSEPMLKRLLAGGQTVPPTTSEIEHARVCEKCRGALKRVELVERGLSAFFEEIQKSAPDMPFKFPSEPEAEKPPLAGSLSKILGKAHRWAEIHPRSRCCFGSFSSGTLSGHPLIWIAQSRPGRDLLS